MKYSNDLLKEGSRFHVNYYQLSSSRNIILTNQDQNINNYYDDVENLLPGKGLLVHTMYYCNEIFF